MASPDHPGTGVPLRRSKAVMRTDCTWARRWEPRKTMNGTRGVPVPKSLEATAIENADGPDTGVGRVAAGAAHPARLTTPSNQMSKPRNMAIATFLMIDPVRSTSGRRSRRAYQCGRLLGSRRRRQPEVGLPGIQGVR